MYSSTKGLVSAESSWICASEKQIADVLSTTNEKKNISEEYRIQHDRCEVVCLERADDGSPCVISLRCSPNSSSVITSLQIVSEARTIEVYSMAGEYCGTCRGEEVQTTNTNGSEDERLFFRNDLILENPSTSCEVKLLSLGGRSSVSIAHLCMGLEPLKGRQAGMGVDPGIDLQCVQRMMEEMGATLSPGAQNLLELVQCQQQNKSDLLNGFIPLLMGGGGGGGGALSSLSRVSGASTVESGLNPASGLEQLQQNPSIMSALLNSESASNLLPMLQSVCGQVTQRRLEETASPERKSNGEGDSDVCCEGLERLLEAVVEKRMDEVEKRLKEHLDQRLDALQQRLENTLQQALSHKQHPTD